MALNKVALDVLSANKVTIGYVDSAMRMSFPLAVRRWIYCGWYWDQTNQKGLVETREGPFKSSSAAGVDALRKLNLMRIVDPDNYGLKNTSATQRHSSGRFHSIGR